MNNSPVPDKNPKADQKAGEQPKSKAIEIPSIALPKGGGAIKGIDEKFSVNAVNGTASFSIQLPFSTARGVSPAINLSYNSGAGNGIFGLGWNISLPSIKRKTEKKLPQYLDLIDSDIFLFSEAEDLVPEYKKVHTEDDTLVFEKDAQGEYIIHENSSNPQFTIRYYKPRIEGLFARIERWTAKESGEIKWRVITKDNVTTLFGWTTESRICHPENENKIFEWLPEWVFDDKGNCTQYIYKTEDTIGFDESLLHNRNRIQNNQITYTNRYLDRVQDLDAIGGKQLVSFGMDSPGFFELDEENDWQPFQTFKAMPNIDFGDPNTRLLDLIGDSMPDIVISEDNVFTGYITATYDVIESNIDYWCHKWRKANR